MDTTTLIILIIVALVAAYLYNRSRTPPQGTYNDDDFRSGGSIGGGPTAYDDKNYRSGGSIGGSSQKANDSSDFDSGGSIGGQRPTRPANPPSQARRSNSTRDTVNRMRKVKPVAKPTEKPKNEKPKHNSRDYKSGGSIGGNHSARD